MFFSISSGAINWDIARTITDFLLSVIAVSISVYAVVKTSRDNNRILEETSRAYISIYTDALVANKSHFYIVFRNFGKSNAFIKDIEIDEKTREMIKIGDKDFISYIMKSNIAPGQSITHVVATNTKKNDKDISDVVATENKKYDQDHISKFEITYLSGGNEYTDIFEFCLGANTRMPSIGLSDGGIDRQFLELYQDQIRKSL